MENQARLSFREMVWPVDDEWAAINDHEQRLKRLEKILIEALKTKLSERPNLETGEIQRDILS